MGGVKLGGQRGGTMGYGQETDYLPGTWQHLGVNNPPKRQGGE